MCVRKHDGIQLVEGPTFRNPVVILGLACALKESQVDKDICISSLHQISGSGYLAAAGTVDRDFHFVFLLPGAIPSRRDSWSIIRLKEYSNSRDSATAGNPRLFRCFGTRSEKGIVTDADVRWWRSGVLIDRIGRLATAAEPCESTHYRMAFTDYESRDILLSREC